MGVGHSQAEMNEVRAQAAAARECADNAKRMYENMMNTHRGQHEQRMQEFQLTQEKHGRQLIEALQASQMLTKKLEDERSSIERRITNAVSEERERAQANKRREWEELNREYPIPDFFKMYISEVAFDVASHASTVKKVNVGILGNSGTGKSSLIKALLERFQCSFEARDKVVLSFQGDGTRMPTPYPIDLFAGAAHLWDLPGQGTNLFPSATYIRDMGLKYFDAVLIVTDGRWTENDSALMQAIKFASIWSVIVRTKVDQAVEDAEYDHAYTQGQALRIIRAQLSQQLLEPDPERLHLVTTRGKHWVGTAAFGTVDALYYQVVEHIAKMVADNSYISATAMPLAEAPGNPSSSCGSECSSWVVPFPSQ